MATAALKEYWAKDIKCYFISNIDGSACEDVFSQVDPETTLFVVVSKTFTTIETLTNARTCRKWLVDALGEYAVAKHFVAVSTNTAEVEKFGINPDNMFEFWDFVGGRYSMWSAVGLTIALAVGMDNFEKMLDGANEMDLHFRHTPFERNIPVIMALLGVWYNNFSAFTNRALFLMTRICAIRPTTCSSWIWKATENQQTRTTSLLNMPPVRFCSAVRGPMSSIRFSS